MHEGLAFGLRPLAPRLQVALKGSELDKDILFLFFERGVLRWPEATAAMGDVTHVASETIQGYRVVRSFGGESYEPPEEHTFAVQSAAAPAEVAAPAPAGGGT